MLFIVVVVVVIVLPSISEALVLPFSYAKQQEQNAATNSAACICYDSTDNIITISCGSASLTDIDNQMQSALYLHLI
jgi:hypothetical protein